MYRILFDEMGAMEKESGIASPISLKDIETEMRVKLGNID
jgi:hypothetical protein